MDFKVEPLGPINRCLRLANLSLFLTNPPILIMSQPTSSSRTEIKIENKKILNKNREIKIISSYF